MLAHAEALEFEQAAEVRNQLSALSSVLHQQAVEANSGGSFDKDADILAVKVQGGRACVNLAMVRGGRHLGDRPYFPTHVEEATGIGASIEATGRGGRRRACSTPEVQVLEAFIAQHYVGTGVPPLLVLSHAVDKTLIEALSAHAGVKVGVQHQPRAQRRGWLEMSVHGAETRARAPARRGRLAAGSHARARRCARSDLRRAGAAAHRVLRHQPHRGRGDAGVVRRVREPQDAKCTVPALQHRRRSPAATTTPRCDRC